MTRKPVEAFIAEDEIVEQEEEAQNFVAPGGPATKKGRVKGTWTMYWGTDVYNFEDGKVYNLPTDLFQYLKINSNIYDTL